MMFLTGWRLWAEMRNPPGILLPARSVSNSVERNVMKSVNRDVSISVRLPAEMGNCTCGSLVPSNVETVATESNGVVLDHVAGSDTLLEGSARPREL
jgi:hypothetical protein